MRYREIIEAHHAPEASDAAARQPIRRGDTLRVFHGFRDFPHAVEAARFGLSGAVRANRVYSYEFDNNPRGLFVTLSLKIASEFAGSHGVSAIVEFNTSDEDLEAPVWPSGNYTVQGQMAQYFGRGAQGRAARKAAGRTADAEAVRTAERDPDHYGAILQSDRPGLADLLLHTREQQALFVGHLDPSAIVAWHVRPGDSRYDAPYARITNDEFLAQYGEAKLDHDSRAVEKLFRPNEDFDGPAFIAKLSARFNKGDDGFIRNYLQETWADILAAGDKRRAIIDERLAYFLWPKQIIGCLTWMRQEFKK